MNIYVGNLPYRTTEAEIQTLFSTHGKVTGVRMVIDRETGRSRGFAFIDMTSEVEGRRAVAALQGSDFNGRILTVNEARAKDGRSGGWSGNGTAAGGRTGAEHAGGTPGRW